jgi:Zn finger protein HypA/HybF involved in hydrogenase expression
MGDQDRGLYNKYQIINRETGKEVNGSYFVLNPVKDYAARQALETYAKNTNNESLMGDLLAWIETMPKLQECDWCGEVAEELSHPHFHDFAVGKRMCENCWNHDREVYKGSYGDDIGEFKAIEGTEV